MSFTARAVKDGLTAGGKAWGVGVNEGGGSLYLDAQGRATLYGADAYVVLADHQPERAVSGRSLTYKNFKIWHLTPGVMFDFAQRPTCGYYLRSVTNGRADSGLYDGTPSAPTSERVALSSACAGPAQEVATQMRSHTLIWSSFG